MELTEQELAIHAIRVEERKRCAAIARNKAEELKHTSHRDGLGMGWIAGEELCEDIAADIERET